jgi:hypothetical protein
MEADRTGIRRMPVSEGTQLQEAVVSLHRQKDAAYGNSWKRRGELISVIANIARKVDRLEAIAVGARPSQDESVLDTAIDLYVYALKYVTFLADEDSATSLAFFGEPRVGSWSDGPTGLERLLGRSNMSPIDRGPADSAEAAVRAILGTFGELEQCFKEFTPSVPPRDRADIAATLAAHALELIGALRDQDSSAYQRFLAAWLNPPARD